MKKSIWSRIDPVPLATLIISLLVSMFMNWFNARVALVER